MKKKCNRFVGDLLVELRCFFDFIKSNIWLTVFALFCITLSYGIKLVYFDFSIDTENYIVNYNEKSIQWKVLDRPGLIALKKIFNGHYLNIFVANYMTYLIWLISILVICFMLTRMYKQKSKISSFIFVAIFSTSPIIAEQFSFVLQSLEVSLGILFVIISILFIYYYFKYNNKIFLLVATLLNAYAFSIYQSLVPAYVALSVISVVLFLSNNRLTENSISFKKYLLRTTPYILILIISYTFTKLFIKVVNMISGLTSANILNQAQTWGKLPNMEILHRIYNDIKNVVIPSGNYFFNYSFFFIIICILLISFVQLAKREKNLTLITFSLFILFLLPFVMTFYLGWSGAIRAQMPLYQIVVGFLFYYSFENITNNYFKILFFAFTSIFTFQQIQNSSNLLMSEHMRYQEDVSTLKEIDSRINNLGISDKSKYSICFVGTKSINNPLNIRGETLGISLFELGVTQTNTSTGRATELLNILGKPYVKPTNEVIQEAIVDSEKMGIWPSTDSVKIDKDNIIVKLSN